MLELAVLGLLHEAPMHGYQLRKQLHARLGTFRAFSWGSLYPTLRRLQRAGLIAETGEAGGEATEEGVEPPASTRARGSWGRRGRRVFELTADGKDRFDELVAEAGPQTWDDESFGVHLAFFSRTPVEVRLRILEGRRSRLEERLHTARHTGPRTRLRTDAYARELYQHGVEGVERELSWLTSLIEAERAGMVPPSQAAVTPSAPGSEP